MAVVQTTMMTALRGLPILPGRVVSMGPGEVLPSRPGKTIA